MVRRILNWIAVATIAIAWAPCAFGQFTAVSGTVVDPRGVPYAYGTVTPTLVAPATEFINPSTPYVAPVQASGLDATGHFIVQLGDNTVLSPSGSQWKFTVCSAVGTVQLAWGTGPQCFTVGPMTISGSSQDITSTLTAAAVALTFPFGSGSSGITASSVGCNTVYNATTTVAGECAILDASKFTGSDICAKIFNAISALPSQGGIIDARNFTGGTCASTPFPTSGGFSTKGSVVLILGSYTLTTNTGWILPNGISILGQPYNRALGEQTGATIIREGSSFPPSTAIITLGTASPIGNALAHFTISCPNPNNGAIAISATSQGPYDLSDMFIDGCASNQISFTFSSTSAFLSDIPSITLNGIYIDGTDTCMWLQNVNNIEVNNIQCHYGSTTNPGILVSGGSNINFQNVRMSREFSFPCYVAGSTSLEIDATGTKSASFTNISGECIGTVIDIQNASGNRSLNFQNIYADANNIIIDSVGGHTITTLNAVSLSYYFIGEGTSPSIVSSSLPPSSVQSSTTATLTADVTIAQNTTTNVFTVASWGTLGVPVTMPSVGCPCRALVSYGAYFSGSTAGVANTWVNDGTNNFAQSQVLVTGSASNFGANGSAFSQGTYANGANISFQLKVNTSNSGGITVTHLPNAGLENTWMNVTIMPSN